MTTSVTQVVSIVIPATFDSDDNWAILLDGKIRVLPKDAREYLVGVGEVQHAIWWFATGKSLPASPAQNIIPAKGLKLLQSQLQLQLAPDATFEAKPLDADRASHEDLRKVNCIEVCLLVTRRCHALLTIRWLGRPTDASDANAPARVPKATRAFEDRLRFWLASVGIGQEAADTVCADRSVAFSIRTRDGSGMYDDLRSALSRLGDAGQEGRDMLRQPLERLRFISYLNRG